MQQIFFSYTHRERAEVERIRLRVLAHAEFDGLVWMDTVQMRAGGDLNKMMHEGISGSTHVVCFLSKEYCASDACMFELRLAAALGRTIVPVVLLPKVQVFPFGCQELSDLVPDTILRIEHTHLPVVVNKIVRSLKPGRSGPTPAERREACPGECEARDFVARQGFTRHDMRNIRGVVRNGQGDLVNNMLKDNLSLRGRFALLRMANEAPDTHRETE